ncbi:MAG: hypothetical protein Q4Q06_07860, partial [Bacteroidota bacterium]|nr:hypothetical protein [Bacteroidota bacterium]
MNSTLTQQIQSTINLWKNATYLRGYSFACEEKLLSQAIETFQTDYNRWFEGNIDIDKLNITPQLQAVLCYR